MDDEPDDEEGEGGNGLEVVADGCNSKDAVALEPEAANVAAGPCCCCCCPLPTYCISASLKSSLNSSTERRT